MKNANMVMAQFPHDLKISENGTSETSYNRLAFKLSSDFPNV